MSNEEVLLAKHKNIIPDKIHVLSNDDNFVSNQKLRFIIRPARAYFDINVYFKNYFVFGALENISSSSILVYKHFNVISKNLSVSDKSLNGIMYEINSEESSPLTIFLEKMPYDLESFSKEDLKWLKPGEMIVFKFNIGPYLKRGLNKNLLTRLHLKNKINLSMKAFYFNNKKNGDFKGRSDVWVGKLISNTTVLRFR